MSTLIGEQTQEIAAMKAIGARGRQIRHVYLRTATLLGALGATVGAVLGIVISYTLTRYFASSFFAISAPFSVDVPVLLASIALGLLGSPLAALPAIRRAARLPLAQTLQATGSAAATQGRLLYPVDTRTQARVVVVEQNLARATGTHFGQLIELSTAAGPARFRVVGIVSDQQDNGMDMFVPLTTLQSVLHTPGAINEFWIQTTSANHHLIDLTNDRLEDTFAAHGLQLMTQVEYAAGAANVAQNRGLTTTITVLGLLIVAISMVGLINTITMTILERTREIGILRCIGGHARDIRRIFATECVALALAGWLVGVPLGLGLAHALTTLSEKVINAHLLFAFPPINIAIVLIGTLVLALLVMQIPLRRPVRFKPGEALRYA
jgi:ABC-type lipoprotein release transport system permease subunit